jgi:hypothetical protein
MEKEFLQTPSVAEGRNAKRDNCEIKRAGCVRIVTVRKDPGPCQFNKEQTPLGDLLDPNPRFHGGSFGVWGHTSSEALKIKL